MRKRIPLRLKFVSVLIFSLSALILGAMYGVRALDLDGCLSIAFSGGIGDNSTVVYDLTTTRTFPQNDPFSGYLTTSPDGRYFLFMQPEHRNSKDFALILAPTDNNSPRIRLQDGISTVIFYSSAPTSVQWSPDASKIAFIWERGDNVFLSIADADGANKQTVSLIDPETTERLPNTQFLHGWSGDGKYLTLSDSYYGQQRGDGFSYWAVDPLRQFNPSWLDDSLYWQGKWSKQGDLVAVVTREQLENAELRIFSPSADQEIVRVPLPDSKVDYMSWSPNDEYLLLARQVDEDKTDALLDLYWLYEFYSPSGELLYQINGTRAAFDAPANNTSQLIGAWTADGNRWLFLRHIEQDIHTLYSVNLVDGQPKVIRENLLGGFAHDILNVSPSSVSSSTPAYTTILETDYLLLPTLIDGKFKFELTDLNGQNPKTLVEDADEIMDIRPFPFDMMFRSLNTNKFIIAWAKGEGDTREVNVTIADVDGTLLHTFDAGEDVSRVNEIYNTTIIGAVVQRDGDYGLELWDYATGETQRLLTNSSRNLMWQWIPYPNSDKGLLTMDSKGGPGMFDMYLLEPDQPLRELVKGAINSPSWAFDGKGVAYLNKVGTNYWVELLRLDSRDVQKVTLPSANGAPLWASNWTDCLSTSNF